MYTDLPALRPSERLLCGPGPTNVDPAVIEAMRKPMLGHLDPELHDILLDVLDMLRRVYRAPDGLVLPLQSTGTAGMEAGLANLLEPGDTAIVARSGFFGGAHRRDRPSGWARGSCRWRPTGARRCRTSACSRRSTTIRTRA